MHVWKPCFCLLVNIPMMWCASSVPVLKGIKRTQAISNIGRTCLPITLQIMSGIKDCLTRQPHSRYNIMLWASCCLAFFGFLQVSKFTVPNQVTYDSATHLSPADISLDDRVNPTLIAVHIKQSKTAPFCKGVTLYLGATNHPICPVAGILPYLALRGSQPGPLFLTKDGVGLTRHAVTTFLDTVLIKLGLHSGSYNTHSFRIGAATTAAEAGIPNRCIQTLGRWQSNAYQQYIQMQPREIAKFSQQLFTQSDRPHL